MAVYNGNGNDDGPFVHLQGKQGTQPSFATFWCSLQWTTTTMPPEVPSQRSFPPPMFLRPWLGQAPALELKAAEEAAEPAVQSVGQQIVQPKFKTRLAPKAGTVVGFLSAGPSTTKENPGAAAPRGPSDGPEDREGTLLP